MPFTIDLSLQLCRALLLLSSDLVSGGDGGWDSSFAWASEITLNSRLQFPAKSKVDNNSTYFIDLLEGLVEIRT